MKTIFMVALAPHAPLDVLYKLVKPVTGSSGATYPTLTCSEFQETSTGLIRLVPLEMQGAETLSVYLHATDIQCVMELSRQPSVGFLSVLQEFPTAAPPSDQAG